MRDYLDELKGAVAVLPTRHGKEAIISPLLERNLGLIVGVTHGVDTDRFGTFSGEIERNGSARDALRQKIAAGFDYAPRARFGLASEGSFSPDRQVGVLASYEEIVMFVDRVTDLEVCGFDVGFQTNYATAFVTSPGTALRFAISAGFPQHAMMISAVVDNRPRPDMQILKGLQSRTELETGVKNLLQRYGQVFVQTDMRAHLNPTRARAIARATEDLVRRLTSPCPHCATPDFSMRQSLGGRPCAICGSPTLLPGIRRYQCLKCGYYLDETDMCPADPVTCPSCNP